MDQGHLKAPKLSFQSSVGTPGQARKHGSGLAMHVVREELLQGRENRSANRQAPRLSVHLVWHALVGHHVVFDRSGADGQHQKTQTFPKRLDYGEAEAVISYL